MAERRLRAPALRPGAPMAEPEYEYRIWQHDAKWHWQVLTMAHQVVWGAQQVLASGVAPSSIMARSAAFTFCLRRQAGEFSG